MLVQATAEYVLAGNIMYINIVGDVSAGYGGICVGWKYNVYKHSQRCCCWPRPSMCWLEI